VGEKREATSAWQKLGGGKKNETGGGRGERGGGSNNSFQIKRKKKAVVYAYSEGIFTKSKSFRVSW